MGFSLINHPFGGTPNSGNPHMHATPLAAPTHGFFSANPCPLTKGYNSTQTPKPNIPFSRHEVKVETPYLPRVPSGSQSRRLEWLLGCMDGKLTLVSQCLSRSWLCANAATCPLTPGCPKGSHFYKHLMLRLA